MELLASLTVLLFLHGAHGAQWSSGSPPDGLTMFVCSGDTVTFTWQYLLDAGDVVGDTEWLYDGHSQELVAIMSHGHFVPLPSFSQRVQAVDNAGITLSKVIVGDSGNYSVEVNLYDAGGVHVVLRRSVFLWVSAGLMTTDGTLHAIQSSEAVLDARTGQLAIQLQCGTFRFTDHPPFTVEWTLPSGATVNSSDFSEGHFNLVLGNPVQGGTYRCTIPPQHAQHACLNANNTHQGQATVVVDKVEARLSLLEKENQQLKQQLCMTNSELSDTKAELSNTKTELSNTKTELSNRVQKLEDTVRYRVAFHATDLLSGTPAQDTPLVFNNVHYNQGGAYNSATGTFVVPADGVYFFISSTGPVNADTYTWHYLYVDNTWIDYSVSYVVKQGNPEMSSVHGVMHLRAGQRVWIRSDGDHYWGGGSSFTGFLLSRDF